MFGLARLDQLFGKSYDFMGQYTAEDVASYVIRKCTLENCAISNLQLQKILYYLQVSFLQEKGRALFSDDIEAWQFGPVVRSVYRKYCGYGAVAIREDEKPHSEISLEDRELIDKIVEEKRRIKSWVLVNMTHEDGKPWDRVYRNGIGEKDVIPKAVIAAYA